MAILTLKVKQDQRHQRPIVIMIISRSILTALLFITLIQCKAKKQERTVTPEFQSFDESIGAVPNVVGEWNYSVMFYSRRLTFLANGIFHYSDRGCTGKSYSEGKWYYSGEEIICQSFDKYKTQLEPIVVTEVTDIKPPVSRKKKREKKAGIANGYDIYDYIDFSQLTTVSFRFPDTAFTFFDHARFKIYRNNLYSLDRNGDLAESKYSQGEWEYAANNISPAAPVLPDLRNTAK